MLRHSTHGHMTTNNGSRGAWRAAMRSPAWLLPRALLALAAALALLLAGGVDRSDAQQTPSTLVSNIGQEHTGGFPLTSDYAQAFTTGPHPGGYVLSSIELKLKTDASAAAPNVKLFSGSASGTEEATLILQGSLAASTTADYAFAPSGLLVLAPSTSYWVVATGGDVEWRGGGATTDANPAAGWSIADLGEDRDTVGVGPFENLNRGTLRIRVNGYATPSDLSVPLTSNINKTRSGAQSLETSDVAQCFRTGNNSYGYPLGSAEVSLTTTANPKPPAFTLHEGSPTGTEVTSYRVLRTPLTASSTGRSYKIVHHPGATLTRATTYCLVARGGVNVSWDYTASNDEDVGGQPGWSISDTGQSRTAGSTSAFTALAGGQSYQLKLTGQVPFTPPSPPYPSPPERLTFTGIPGGFTASWSDLPSGGAESVEPVTKYQYRYFESNSPPYTAPASSQWKDVEGGSSARSVTVEGLEATPAWMLLWVEVRAVNSVGAGVQARAFGRALAPLPPIWVSNFDQAESAKFSVSGTNEAAQQFTTGPSRDGHVLVLKSVAIRIQTLSSSATTPPTVTLGTTPDGAALATLTLPGGA